MNIKRIIIASLIMLLAVIGACDREIDSRDPVRSVPQDGPVPNNLVVFVNNQSITISWDISDASDVGKYHIYVATEPEGSDDFDFVLHDSTTSITIQLNQLTINKRYYFRVAAVSKLGLEWKQSEVVDALFTYLSIDVEHGKDRINSRSVRVQINAPTQTSHIMLSEDSTFTYEDWIPYSGTSTNFELSDSDGVKWVYARLQFDDGSLTNILSDSIILDTRAVIDSVFFDTPDNGNYFVIGDTIIFGVATGETGGEASVTFGGVQSGAIDMYDDGTEADSIADDGIYYGVWVVPTSFTLDRGEVTGHFTDEAGNNANDYTSSELLTIFTSPQAVTLSAEALSTHQINLSWTQTNSSTENFNSYRIYRSKSSTVSESSTLDTMFTTISTTSYIDILLDDNTTYFYRIYVDDKSGLSTASEIVNATTFVNTPPETVDLFVVDNGDSTSVDLAWIESNEEYFESYRIFRSESAGTSEPALGQFTTLVWKGDNINTVQSNGINLPEVENSNTNWYFVVYIYDKHGESTASNVVSVPAPVTPPPEE